MALYSVKITIAADNTAQAVTDAVLTAASISLSKSKANQITVYSETGNDATLPARLGGAQSHRANAIGLPLLPGFERTFAAAGGLGINPHDVKTTYVSGKQNDVFNFTWLTE